MTNIRTSGKKIQHLFQGNVSGMVIFTLSLLITIALFGLFFALLHPDFDTIDDASLMLIASGVTPGMPCEYLPYTNIIIGLAVQFLYTNIPGINWYPIYLYAAHFIAMLVILFSALRMRFTWTTVIHYLFLWIVFEVPLLMNLQYTSTAFIVALGGCCSLIASLGLRGRASWYVVAVSVLLFVFAGLIRYEVLYCAFLLLAPILAIEFFERKTVIIPACIVVSLILFFLGMEYNKNYYSNDPSWKEYFEYNEIRARLHNHPKLEYNEQNKPVFGQIGWSENDFRIFKSWFFFDHDVYSKAKLAFLDQNLKNGRTIRGTLSVLREAMLPARVILALGAMYVILSWIWIDRGKRKYFFCVIVPAIAVCLYLSYTAHLPRYRVFVPIVVWVNYMLFFLVMDSPCIAWETTPFFKKIISTAAIVLATVILLPMLLSMIKQWDTANMNKAVEREMRIRLLSSSEEKLYIIWNGGTLRLGYNPLFSNLNEYKKLHLIFSGWSIYSPFQEKRLAAYGIDNVYLSFDETSRVYLVMNTVARKKEMLKKFMLEHYRQKIEFKLVDSYKTMGIYKTRKAG